MLIDQRREHFFFLILLVERAKITRSRLVLRLPSNSLSYREVVAKSFCVIYEECIEELKDPSENKNTEKSVEYSEDFFQKWANERNYQTNFQQCERNVLDQTLTQIYAKSRKENGGSHEPNYLKVMQASLREHGKGRASRLIFNFDQSSGGSPLPERPARRRHSKGSTRTTRTTENEH